MRRRALGKLREAGAAFYAKEEDVSGNPFLAALASRNNEQAVEVWPENWKAFSLFCDLQTQWNVGFGGATGIRYESAYRLIDRLAADDDEWQALFEDLQVLERAALKQMSENRSDT